MIRYKISKFFKNLKYKFQRANKGYCEKDTWNIDIWFLEIIPKILGELKTNTRSFPSGMTIDEWKNILSEMINYFKEANEDTTSFKNKYEAEFFEKVSPKFCISRYGLYKDLTSEELEIKNKFHEEERNKKFYLLENKEKGLQLFCKWFNDLWD